MMEYPIKPYFDAREPIKQSIELKQVNVKTYGDGDTILDTDDKLFVLNVELEYSGCYYESDRPSVKVEITEYDKIPYDDVEFLSRKRSYARAKAKYKRDIKKYNEDLAKYNLEQERKLYLKLKKKLGIEK